MNKKILQMILLTVIISIISSGCASSGISLNTQPEPQKIKLASFIIIDLLPIYVAQAEGIFENYGVDVEILPIFSASERDSLMVAKEADGMTGDFLSILLYNQEEYQIQLVRYAAQANEENPIFTVVASGSSDVLSVEDLKGVEIGNSEYTLTHYFTDRYLESAGFSEEEIKYVFVPKIPDRNALILEGKIEAGLLPTNLAGQAIQNGAKFIFNDSERPDLSWSSWQFRSEFIEEHPEAIEGFLAGLEEATNLVNEDPNKWKQLAIDNNLIPEPIKDIYVVPHFVEAGVPGKDQFDDVYAWALKNGIITNLDISYEKSVNSEFLP
jgi:NitT/TauT family transport system substrate-binding protein